MAKKRSTKVDSMQGALSAMILKALSWGPLHGYAVARWIEGVSGADLLVEEGSLYPTLRRLEEKDWLTSRWSTSETGRRVKIYRLTEEGRSQLLAEVSRWRSFSRAVTRVLNATEAA